MINSILTEEGLMSRVKIKRLNEMATIPTRGSKEAAGYDLYAAIPESIRIILMKQLKLELV